jgi:hypothetical protein
MTTDGLHSVLPVRLFLTDTRGSQYRRRLRKDEEVLPQTSEALIPVAMTTRLVPRLARPRRAVHQAAQALPQPLSPPSTRAA